MRLNNIFNLSNMFYSLASEAAKLSEDEVKSIISEELSLVRDILLSVKEQSIPKIDDKILKVKNIASKCMRLIRQHLPPQGKRSWSEYRINAMTTAYYGLSSYSDTGNLSGIDEAIRVIDELLEK